MTDRSGSSPSAPCPRPPHAAATGAASVCFRVGTPIWMNATRFAELLAVLDRHPGVADEVTLFTSETHPPLPLDVVHARMPVLAERMTVARRHGLRAGINVLATIGHHEENLPNSLAGHYTPMTAIDGRICRGSYCPNDSGFREYVASLYAAVAAASPDYIWLDDDIRLWGHMPIAAGCFCPTCLDLLSARTGRAWSRDSLRSALAAGEASSQELRRAVLAHNRATVGRLLELVEATVHAAVPAMPLGFMTGDRFYEGYDFDEWARLLAGTAGAEVRWRPGGGTYTDDRLADIVGKAHDIGRQTALLPCRVQRIQSEIESFPYQRLKKAVRSTALEAAAYIAAGCTGAAYNVLTQYDEPLDEFVPLVQGLASARPFLDLLTENLGRTPALGIHSGWVKDSFAAANPDGDWLAAGPGAPGHCTEIWSTGLPAAYTARGACVTALAGDQVLALDDEQIGAILAGGVYLDGPALTRLNQRGWGRLTGFEVEAVAHQDCIEEFGNHPLNGPLAGRRRNGRQSFWKCPTSLLRATAPDSSGLSRCVDYTYRPVHPICMGLFANPAGGRVCVAGYYPWEQLQTGSKATQLKGVMRWLSGDRLPAWVSSFHRINLWVRGPHAPASGTPETTPWAIALLNACLDPAEGVELLVRTARDRLCLRDSHGGSATVAGAAADGPYRRFRLPRIEPWDLVLATV